MVKSLHLLLVLALLATACGDDAVATGQPLPQATQLQGTTTVAVGSDDPCPLTVPPEPGFVPPEPNPPEAPALYQAIWYGTSELWTMLGHKGEVWAGLPVDEHGFGQKTFWWSDGYSWTAEPTPPITVTGRQLDGSASFEAGGPGTNGFREDIGSFMLVGIGIPETGCWELTAWYGDAALSYVVKVEE